MYGTGGMYYLFYYCWCLKCLCINVLRGLDVRVNESGKHTVEMYAGDRRCKYCGNVKRSGIKDCAFILGNSGVKAPIFSFWDKLTN